MSDETRIDTMIPEVWATELVRHLGGESALARFRAQTLYPYTPPAWHIRKWRRLKSWPHRTRERLALTLAPWLEQNEWD